MTEREPVFPPYPAGLDDAWVDRVGRVMVARASQVPDEASLAGWLALGCWLLDVVDHRRSEFDKIVGAPETGGLVSGFDEAIQEARAMWRRGIDGDDARPV